MVILNRKFVSKIAASFLFLAAVGVIINYWKEQAQIQENKVAATQVLSQYRAQLERELLQNLALTAGIKSYISVHPEMTQQQFSAFAQDMLTHHSQIRNIGAAKDLVITHIYPLQNNVKALGLDYKSIPVQYAAVLRALESDKVLLDGPVDLVQGGKGLIARQKIVNSQNGEFWGVLSVVIDYDLLFTTVNHLFPQVKVAIKQAEAPNKAVYGEQSIFERAQATSVIGLPIGSWLIAIDWHNLNQHKGSAVVIIVPLILLWMLILLVFQREERYQQQLKIQTAAANQANQTKSLFLANMSHEIRTPLNGVIGTLQILKQSPLETKQKKLTDSALFSARKLLTIISDILDFSKIEANKIEVENIPFELDDIITFVEFSFNQMAKEKGVAFTVEVQDAIPPYWAGDPTRIGQILLNLVSNGIKFTEQGRVILRISHEHSAETDYLILRVEDTGTGMDAQELSRAFEPFTQTDSSITRRFGGTGLGLVICKNLVTALKGNMQVKSAKGEGTKFEVKLPLTIEKPPVDRLTEESDSVPNLHGKVLLVAEDNEINQMVMLHALEPTGATIYMANNGIEACEKVQQYSPNLILMDIQMPKMDGVAATLSIRKKDHTTPIIAFTANVMAEEIAQYSQQGFNAYLSKPFDLDKLYSLLTKYLLSPK
ncbi:ATP-binding protein [Paraglaciecola sp. L3A3]|uniref:ATP-binding protein n=1 Tax=Paraglaciecola sp. L3A3 TaxID=2686358 RepID=UPI00131D5F1D|nr:ATP-binding protein [Paraglaciecola sp. L3A3]